MTLIQQDLIDCWQIASENEVDAIISDATEKEFLEALGLQILRRSRNSGSDTPVSAGYARLMYRPTDLKLFVEQWHDGTLTQYNDGTPIADAIKTYRHLKHNL